MSLINFPLTHLHQKLNPQKKAIFSWNLKGQNCQEESNKFDHKWSHLIPPKKNVNYQPEDLVIIL